MNIVSANLHLSLASKGIGDIQHTGWNILAEDISLPVAVLKQSALQNNLEWMANYANQVGVKLAPHGKTSMAPALFKAQMAAGAWGMTLATAPQVAAACEQGIERVLMANQLVGKRNFEIIAQLLSTTTLEFYCFVDSMANVTRLNQFFAKQGLTLNVLIEVGVESGRCGVRGDQQALALAEHVKALSNVKLRGVAFYEGVIRGDDPAHTIRHFVENIKQLTHLMAERQLFAEGDIIISGAGSAWYDIVAEQLSSSTLPAGWLVVIRPGCYVIHDTGIYQSAQQQLRERSNLACEISGDLISSLEIWAYVQSVPEPGMAIIGFGKRDAAFDAGLPTPECHFRPGWQHTVCINEQWQLTKIMDQHAMLSFPPDSDLQPGDIMNFSTSHPCLTLDKWRTLAIVDDNLNVIDLIETQF
ncbi:amino acid deaminase [Paraglaciecola sp.]|uniref:amino acid deaminase n=1 Tax=Paraglaciecola sp. TaxID=1920173 RepID=UPI0030F4A510